MAALPPPARGSWPDRRARARRPRSGNCRISGATIRWASSYRSRSSASEADESRCEQLARTAPGRFGDLRLDGRIEAGRRRRDVDELRRSVARRVAATASARTDPSSIHVSSVRSSIRACSTAGSRGARGPRRMRTSAARRSASVRGSGRPPVPRPPRGGRDEPAFGSVPRRARWAAAARTGIVAIAATRARRPRLRAAVGTTRRPASPGTARARGAPSPAAATAGRAMPGGGGRTTACAPGPAGCRRRRQVGQSGAGVVMAALASLHATPGNDEGRRSDDQRPSLRETGGVLLSQGFSPQVPSALTGLTSVFGMGTGVTLSLWPPEISCQRVLSHSRTPEQARAVNPSPRPISTGRLNTLLCVHLRPINVMVSSRALLR